MVRLVDWNCEAFVVVLYEVIDRVGCVLTIAGVMGGFVWSEGFSYLQEWMSSS